LTAEAAFLQPRLIRSCLGGGPLSGFRFAAKDLIDVAGAVTGGGNPDWTRTHRAAARDARCVAALLTAGANLVGKTVTDELAFSLEGDNQHFPPIANPRAPGRLPGGSSSGSAAAVAAGLADIALGTDTGGSVRVPAAFCGVYGFRPTHGRIALHGVIPFAPSYDTVGWFAAHCAALLRAGAVLLGEAIPSMPRLPPLLLLPADVWRLADRRAAAVLRRIADALGAKPMRLWQRPALEAHTCYRAVQGFEIWRTHRAWIARVRPRFAPNVAPRFADAAAVSADEYAAMRRQRRSFAAAAHDAVAGGNLLVVPTAPGTAPLRGRLRADFYPRALALNAVAGHAGLPQVTLPVASLAGAPLGLSLIGAAGSDAQLLAAARLLARRLSLP
jgi:amidase